MTDLEKLKTKLGGMTVNERLFETGQLGEFDRALADKDESQVRKILESVFVDEGSIAKILKGMQSNR